MDHAAAIKEYSRSSADQEEPLPHDLRPLPVLSMTMDYLVTQIMDRGPDSHRDWYDFVWNRTRGIRKVSVRAATSSRFPHGGGLTVPLCSGHHPAAALLPPHRVADREMHQVPRSLRPPPLRAAHVVLRRQDQQREHDQVSAESEGNVRGSGDAADVLPPGGRVPPVQRPAEAQRRRHPAVSRSETSACCNAAA